METILRYLMLGLALGLFTVYHFSPEGKKSSAGLMMRWLTVIISTAATLYLVSLFFGRHYEVKYVYENSNNSLSALYRLSAVWAGQAGTLLVWYWMTAVPMVLIRNVDERNERMLYLGMSLVLIMLGVFIARVSPFELMAKPSEMAKLLKSGAFKDGAGLNPLLINPWMAIHPPLVFVGYALVAVPFGYALAAVHNKDYTGWMSQARWWALAGWAFLGAGIFIGSYWAYEVLGWGGYWGWDPVENASIFPWLMLGAFLHGMLIQGGGKNRFQFWNILLALGSMISVMLTAYLTRSGALSQFSVHSFEKSDLYYPLTISLVMFTLYCQNVALVAFKDINAMHSGETEAEKKAHQSVPMTATLLTLTVMVLLILLGFVVAGTFYPIIAPLGGAKAASLDQKYYNKITFAMALPLGALLIACPFFFIKKMKGIGDTARYLAASAGAGLAVVLLVLSRPVNTAFYVLAPLGGAALMAHLLNGIHFAKLRRWNWASYMVHVGVGLLIIGVLTSASGMKTKTISILQGYAENWGQHGQLNIKFSRIKPLPDEHSDLVYLKVTSLGGQSKEVELRFTAQTPDNRVPPKPAIINSFMRDIYIAPRSIELETVSSSKNPMSDAAEGAVVIEKGKRVKVGRQELEMVKWKVGNHEQSMSVTALVNVYDGGTKKEIELPFSPMLKERDDKELIALPDGTMVKITHLDVSSVSAELQVVTPGQDPKTAPAPQPSRVDETLEVPRIYIEVTEKPFISILWWGMILICAGTFLSLMVKRYERASAKA